MEAGHAVLEIEFLQVNSISVVSLYVIDSSTKGQELSM